MEPRLRHTLISDGPTDANLIPIINWTLREAGGVVLPDGVRAEFWRLPAPPGSLADRIRKAVELYPCDVLFVHRDAEKDPPGSRDAEIQAAVARAAESGCRIPAVAVIPVRMLEAWLLFDERAIRQAAGNPNGQVVLPLPPMSKLERRPDPKQDLRDALRAASELSGRRLKKFDTRQAFWRVVDFIEDFSPLRQLRAFAAFEDSVRRICQNKWAPGFYGLGQAASE
jgi:hypothetical protein